MLRLAYERHKRGWSQTEVGRLVKHVGGHHCEFSQEKVSLFELGQRKPTEPELAALAHLFQISPAFVLLKPIDSLQDADERTSEQVSA